MILRNGQDRSLHAQNTIYRVGRGLAPAVGFDIICGGGKPPPYPENFISCVGNGLDRSAKLQRVLTGEHSSPLRIVGNDLSVVPQSHIKCSGGRGNPPLQRGAESSPPTTFPRTSIIHYAFFIMHLFPCRPYALSFCAVRRRISFRTFYTLRCLRFFASRRMTNKMKIHMSSPFLFCRFRLFLY